jgi:hypothetical protein
MMPGADPFGPRTHHHSGGQPPGRSLPAQAHYGIYDIELKRALERHEASKARVVPIIVRKVAWYSAPFGKLQALPADGKVVDRGTGGRAARDAAWSAVAEGLERVLRELASSRA